ncbi:peroxiredoxin [Halomarina halobia]|uniref:thioredoxin-dependent peroxiredoxin n=1 Tax=Halomarina halobia TaxID=3033386 RepID=A0ABD6AE84_9EURY|nr:peroxiredoxin [Halomarina sp. PSR21]
MPLEPGDPAPQVSAPNQDGAEITVPFDEPTVVYFYPADDTPGCTTEATEFTKEQGAYREAGVSVYGVSVDDVDSHAAFAEQHGIEFDLLADPDGEIAGAFDVDRRASGETERTTFVVVDGEVYAVYTDVKPNGHAREVLGTLLDDGVVDLE